MINEIIINYYKEKGHKITKTSHGLTEIEINDQLTTLLIDTNKHDDAVVISCNIRYKEFNSTTIRVITLTIYLNDPKFFDILETITKCAITLKQDVKISELRNHFSPYSINISLLTS